jgi:hypothetical protein
MFRTKTKLDDLLERYKDLNHVYVVKNKLVECDNLVQYYLILCTKKQMEDSNATLNECWKLAESKNVEKFGYTQDR